MYLSAQLSQQPPLNGWRDHAALLDGDWPSIETLNLWRVAAEQRDGIRRPELRAQTPALLADGLHYEQRIAAGCLATRDGDAHDLFNALIWLRHASIKWALNARQCADIAVHGPKQRSRGQYAMTHFDEAGAIVWIADDAALACWDGHDWEGLFRDHAHAWGRRIAVTVFGHALHEHVAQRDLLPMGRSLVVRMDADEIERRSDARGLLASWPQAEACLATAIRDSVLLTDPQQLRPLPLAGLPGWHRDGAAKDFFQLPCFRPLREERHYPKPFALATAPRASTDTGNFL